MILRRAEDPSDFFIDLQFIDARHRVFLKGLQGSLDHAADFDRPSGLWLHVSRVQLPDKRTRQPASLYFPPPSPIKMLTRPKSHPISEGMFLSPALIPGASVQARAGLNHHALRQCVSLPVGTRSSYNSTILTTPASISWSRVAFTLL